MENKGLTAPKWMLTVWLKIPQMPKSSKFQWTKASSGVRSPWGHLSSLLRLNKFAKAFQCKNCYYVHCKIDPLWIEFYCRALKSFDIQNAFKNTLGMHQIIKVRSFACALSTHTHLLCNSQTKQFHQRIHRTLFWQAKEGPSMIKNEKISEFAKQSCYLDLNFRTLNS